MNHVKALSMGGALLLGAALATPAAAQLGGALGGALGARSPAGGIGAMGAGGLGVGGTIARPTAGASGSMGTTLSTPSPAPVTGAASA
ncbi:MAG: hypothetical protein JO256_03400, partial [Alphaproteobacteria bacterium]|nr:hypothetical protein [Alphaproteobacteria bacterium]